MCVMTSSSGLQLKDRFVVVSSFLGGGVMSKGVTREKPL